MAQLVNLLVDVGVLLNVGIRAGDVGFRLVVVVVADEVLHGVVGEEVLELRGKLGGQGLVGRDDQRWPLHALHHFGHGEGLAGAGDAQQHLLPQAAL